MAPDPDKREEHPVLEQLKKPWSALKLTEAQDQERHERTTAKKLWEEVLETFREEKKTLFAKGGTKEIEADQPFFPFLELPPDIRNMVYDLYLEDDQDLRESRMRFDTQEQWRGSKSKHVIEKYHNRAVERRSTSPTPEQEKREGKRRKLLEKIIKARISQATADGELTSGTHEAFKRYQLEHEMYTRRCWHEGHAEDSEEEKPGYRVVGENKARNKRVAREDGERVLVNARGNLCDDLPLLALTNRQIFSETFYLFYSVPREGLWFKWTIKNLDFFPFLRFWQRFGKQPWPVELTPEMVHVEIDDTDEWKDDDLHTRKFQNVKRLIELHWLQGFPLWGCLTGLSDHQDCKGPFGDWIYSVRQVVALYRVDPQLWKDLSIQSIREVADSVEISELEWETKPDEELVESVIKILDEAIKYHLGYHSDYLLGRRFPLVGRDGKKWNWDVFEPFRFNEKKFASQREHSVVLVVQRYCVKVDKALREKLGEAYEEWERLPDKEIIPQGVVL